MMPFLKNFFRYFFAISFLLFIPQSASALQQVETEHYVVVFNTGDEFYAHQIILIAEEVWDDLITAYDLFEDYKKIHIYIKDPGDYANGYAIAEKNMVTIYTTHLHAGIRGTSNWLRNVVTHELAHVFSIKAANKNMLFNNYTLSTSSYFQNPDWAVAVQYRNFLAPRWWVEGIAQYDAYKNKNDFWDTHRDMFLRMATLEGELLNYVEMGTFGNRHGLYGEMVYNQGYSMVLHIDSVYGEQAVRKSALAKSYFNFNRSLRKAIGKRGQELYEEWHEALKSKYAQQTRSIRKNLIEGKELFDGGFWDHFISYSPDGKYAAFVSNKDYEVWFPHLYIKDLKTGSVRRLLKRSESVDSRIQWFPDSKKIIYSRWTKNAPFLDVYTYDLEKDEEKQITWQARAFDPTVSPDGKTIAYIHNKSGIQNLALVDTDGKNSRQLTNFNNGTQLYAPCYTPDGKKIIMGIFYNDDRDIAVVDASAESLNRIRKLTDTTHFVDSLSYQEDLDFMLMVHTEHDERDPCVSPDGKYLYFSSDKSGIFNIYRMSLEDWKVERITNVLGGAFIPSVHPDGNKIVYTGFHAANFNLYELPIEKTEEVELIYVTRDYSKRNQEPFIFSSGGANPKSKTKPYQYSVGKYTPKFTFWNFSPFLSYVPAFITDEIGESQLRGGLNIATGELSGFSNFQGSVYGGKQVRDEAGLTWGANMSTSIGFPQVAGENKNFFPSVSGFAYHDVIKSHDKFVAPNITVNTMPDEAFYHVDDFSGDTVITDYLYDESGSISFEDVYNYYGVNGGLVLNRKNQIGLSYSRRNIYANSSIHDEVLRLESRVYLKQGNRLTRDITDSLSDRSRYQALIDDIDTTLPPESINKYLDHHNRYQSHQTGLNYSFINIDPAFIIPVRIDYLSFATELIYSKYSLGETNFSDTAVTINSAGEQFLVPVNSAGDEVPLLKSVNDSEEFVRFEFFGMERIPLFPRNKHFITTQLFFESVNRKLSTNSNLFPLRYRVGWFLKAYPYSFDPIDIADSTFRVPIYALSPADSSIFVTGDSLHFDYLVDTQNKDILWGNRLLYLNFEYTIELFRGLTFKPLGMLFQGIYLTPFFEMASVWNTDLSTFTFAELLGKDPSKKNSQYGDTYLKDFGIRLELPVVLFENWNGFFTFTWARRIDLDDEIADIQEDANSIKYIGLDKDRFSIGFQLVNL